MPNETATPQFPSPEMLRKFFRTDPHSAVPLSQAARLLGLTTAAFRRLLDAEGGHGLKKTVPWHEAAAYLFDAWSRERILEALGEEEAARVIPAEFRLVRVEWQLPLFLVRALLHQAAQEGAPDHRLRRRLPPDPVYARGVDDYVADLLYMEIRPETLEHFGGDAAFMAAYLYPVPE